MIERKTYSALPEIKGPYVHAVKHRDTLYVSGLTAMGTAAQASDGVAQAQEILRQLEVVLQEEDLAKANLVKVTIFLTTIADLPKFRTVLTEFYEGHLPACSLVEISQLVHPDLKIEIEAVIAL